MRPLIVTALRRTLGAAWAVAVMGLIALAAWSHLSALIVITGGSMEPAVPVGAVIGPAVVGPGDVVAGDILTVKADNGVLVTHRVVRVVDLPEGRFFELKGDANATPDPELVPARAVIGRVDGYLPYAGFALALLSIPSGLVFMVATLGTVLICIWLLEDVEVGFRSAARQRAPATAARGLTA